MAFIYSIFGKISGAVGNIIFDSRPGRNIARSRTLPEIPGTTLQTHYRDRLSFLSHMASLFFDPVLVNFWKHDLSETDIRNDFVSYNSNFITTVPDYPHLFCSFGPLNQLTNYRADYYLSQGRIRCRWNVVYGGNLLPTDYVLGVCIYPLGNKLFYSATPAFYSAGLLNYYIARGIPYHTIYTYAFAFRPLGSYYLAGLSKYDEPAWT
jgi:hypothetical protein